jgi:hypothetical protein
MNVRLTIQVFLTTAAIFFAGPLWAQDAPAGEAEADVVTDAEYDFEDDLVEGEFVRPEGEYFSGDKRNRYSSLIRIRLDFVPEMLKSAEDI